jgi:hypothetical protein
MLGPQQEIAPGSRHIIQSPESQQHYQHTSGNHQTTICSRWLPDVPAHIRQPSDQDLFEMVTRCMLVLLPDTPGCIHSPVLPLSAGPAWHCPTLGLGRQLGCSGSRWLVTAPEVDSDVQVLVCTLLIVYQGRFHDVQTTWENCSIELSLLGEVGPVCQKCHPFPWTRKKQRFLEPSE